MKNWTNRTKLLLLAALWVALAFAIHPKPAVAVSPNPNQPTDPCLYQPMNQVPIAVATAAGPTSLIPGIAGLEIHVCQVPATVPTSSTYQLYQGPSSGTGLVPMTGALTSVPTSPDMTLYRAAVGQSIFLKTTGTGMQGTINYVYEVPPFQYATTTPFVTATPTLSPTPTLTPTATPT